MTDKPELDVNVEEARQELERLQEQAEAAMHRQTHAERDHVAARLRMEEARCEVFRRQLVNIQDDNEDMSKELMALLTQVENLTEEIERVDAENSDLLQQLGEVKEQNVGLQQEVHGLRKHLKGEQRRPKLVLEDVLNIISNEADKQQTLGYAGVATALDGCRQVVEEAFVGILKGKNND